MESIAEHSSPSRKPALFGAVAIALSALWFGAIFGLSGYAIDDTYIHLQFAENLSQGLGFRFHPDEPPVYGCTSPAWVALLALGRWMGWEGLGLARLLSSLFGMAGVWLVAWLGWAHVRRPWGLLAGVLLAINPWWVRWSASGMEAVFAADLFLAAWALVVVLRPGWARALALGGLCGAAVVVRPELAMLAWVVWLGGGFVRKDFGTGRRDPALWTLPACWLAVVVGWAVFCYFHFGSILPTAVSAKADETGYGPYLAGALPRLALTWGVSDGFLIALAAVGFLLRRPLALSRTARPLPLFALLWPLAVLGFLLAGRGPVQTRYLLLAWPALLVVATRGLGQALEACRAGRWGSVWTVRRRRLAVALCLGLPVGQAVAAGWGLVYPHMRTVTANLSVYREVADYLRRETPAEARIAVHEIGVFGYYGGRRLFDLGGLISPEVNHRPTRGQDEGLTVAPEFLLAHGVTHYLDPHGRVDEVVAAGRFPHLRFDLLAQWTFAGGTALTDRQTYVRRLYRLSEAPSPSPSPSSSP